MHDAEGASKLDCTSMQVHARSLVPELHLDAALHRVWSGHAQYPNFFMSRSRALPAFVRSADLGVDRGLTGIRQAGACTTSFTSVLFPSAHQVHYTHRETSS